MFRLGLVRESVICAEWCVIKFLIWFWLCKSDKFWCISCINLMMLIICSLKAIFSQALKAIRVYWFWFSFRHLIFTEFRATRVTIFVRTVLFFFLPFPYWNYFKSVRFRNMDNLSVTGYKKCMQTELYQLAAQKKKKQMGLYKKMSWDRLWVGLTQSSLLNNNQQFILILLFNNVTLSEWCVNQKFKWGCEIPENPGGHLQMKPEACLGLYWEGNKGSKP